MASLLNSRRQRGLNCSTALCVASLLACLLTGFVPFGKAGTQPEGNTGPSQVTAQFAIADFDGDSRPDLASVQSGQCGSSATHYFIDFRLTSGLPQTIGVTAPTGGLRLASRDVNGDDFLDVIVTTFWTNQPLAVLLNDGRGNFTQSEPSAFPRAFTASQNSRISKPNAVTDATAALFSRKLPGESKECKRVPSLGAASGRLVTSILHFAGLSRSDSFFGRSPPSLTLHR